MQLLSTASSGGFHSAPFPSRDVSRVTQSLGDDDGVSIPSHPLSVKPSGNQYTAETNIRNNIGAFVGLPDEIIFMILELLDSETLLQLGSSCKTFYAFTNSDELWRALFLTQSGLDPSEIKWRGNWRNTLSCRDSKQQATILCENLFSDVLYRPFLCTYTSLAPYSSQIPTRNAIPRLGDLSPAKFSSQWNDKPFILEKPVREWPVYKSWDLETLLAEYGNIPFRAEAVDWPLYTYYEYMKNSADESPLYLFDRFFVEKMGLAVGRDKKDAAYWIPDCFGEDLFTVLGENRPDSRWLIIGPTRSGSTFHKDPNATSAWNAVLRGSKYWIMFPSQSGAACPPGVFMSEDQSEVTSPLSITEWLLGFHEEARRTPGCMEGICNEGEILHVPSGWWHLVVNLEPSVAITQNFVPRSHLVSVLSFLRDKPAQISGFKKDLADPYAAFVDCMKEQHPGVLEQALHDLEAQTVRRKRKWDTTIGFQAKEEAFSFGFEDGDSDEEIP